MRLTAELEGESAADASQIPVGERPKIRAKLEREHGGLGTSTESVRSGEI